MTTWALFGAALGFVFRSVVVPIGLGIVWVVGVENLMANWVGDVRENLVWRTGDSLCVRHD
jgi:ABC-2 type transport system permease protein